MLTLQGIINFKYGIGILIAIILNYLLMLLLSTLKTLLSEIIFSISCKAIKSTQRNPM